MNKVYIQHLILLRLTTISYRVAVGVGGRVFENSDAGRSWSFAEGPI